MSAYYQTYGSRWRAEPTVHKLMDKDHIACRPLGPLPYGDLIADPDDPDYPLPRRCRICFTAEYAELDIEPVRKGGGI